MQKGLIIVHTGDGKGKTTAALGLAIRAWGDGLRVLIMQFIKGSWKYGELSSLQKLGQIDGRMEIRQCGHGFTQQPGEDQAEHRQAAAAALQEAKRAAASGKWDMIILDELNYAVKFGLVSLEEVLDLLQSKPPMLHLVLTGRDARQELIDAADLVTEMKLIKHPFQNGIKAQKGVEF
jgi:cob(I)alamin adenosyltransferase